MAACATAETTRRFGFQKSTLRKLRWQLALLFSWLERSAHNGVVGGSSPSGPTNSIQSRAPDQCLALLTLRWQWLGIF